tara:strand:+ start:46 stop:372 length:327 start_codon:yes stop_codon:yes gene_type:complete
MNWHKKDNHYYTAPLNEEAFSRIHMSEIKIDRDLIIDLSLIQNPIPPQYDLMYKISEEVNNQDYCIVYVINTIASEILSQSLNMVPSLREAEDYVKMEQIQRDLGIQT